MKPLSKNECRKRAISNAKFAFGDARLTAVEYTGVTQDAQEINWLYLVTCSRISPKEDLEPQLNRLKGIRREEDLDTVMLEKLSEASEAEDAFCSSVIEKLEAGVEIDEILLCLESQVAPCVVLVREQEELENELARRFYWNAGHANGHWPEPECDFYFWFSSHLVGGTGRVTSRKTLTENGLRRVRASGNPSAGTACSPPYRSSPTRFARTRRATTDRVPSRRPFATGLPTFLEESLISFRFQEEF